MYDEVTRQQDHYWASLAYAQEEGRAAGHADGMAAGRAEGRAEGMRLGIEQGIEQGIELGKEKERNTLISLIKDGYISPKVAAEKLNISIDELDKYL